MQNEVDLRDRLLTAEELSKITGISKFTLEEWRQAGHGPKYVLLSKRHLRYRTEDVQAWISALEGK